MIARIKILLIKIFASVGYEFVRIKRTPRRVIDVFPLIVEHYIHKSGRSPFFLQIGANDGVEFDPLRPLVRSDWHGLLIEPNPEAFVKLRQNYAERDYPHLRFDRVAIADRDGTVKLHFGKDSKVASLDMGTAQIAAGGTVNVMEVPAVTLATLFRKHSITAIDIFQCDAEGRDFDIISQLLSVGMLPNIIQFEHSLMTVDQHNTLCDRLVSARYSLLLAGIDTICLLERDN